MIGSEGTRSKVLRIDIPTGLGAAPTSSASPPTTAPRPRATRSPSPTGQVPSASPSGEDSGASEDDVPEDTGTSATSRQGTLAALGLAAAIAIVAGSVVVLIRRP